MKVPATWRELLAEIAREPQERERIAHELNIHPVTISRWMHQESVPRLDNLRRLLSAIPTSEQRKHFFDLLMHDFPAIALHIDADEPLHVVASEFYARAFKMYVTTPASMRFWSLGQLILQHLLQLLDPEWQHVAVLLLRCQPPIKQTIRSLHGVMGVGITPWGDNLAAQTTFAGAESFVGQVFLLGHPALIANSETYNGLLPRTEYPLLPSLAPLPQSRARLVASEMAAPIISGDKSAGVLHVCSTRSNSFHASHLRILQEYASLATLAFAPEDFYARTDILLHILPPPWAQRPVLLQLSDRILGIMRGMMAEQLPLDRSRAEAIAWQQMEEELIQRAFHK